MGGLRDPPVRRKQGALAWIGLVDTRETRHFNAALTQYVEIIFDAMVQRPGHYSDALYFKGILHEKRLRSALSAALLGAAALVAGCAYGARTTLDVTWAAPQIPPAKSFKKLLIITVAANEFVQEAFQKQLAARTEEARRERRGLPPLFRPLHRRRAGALQAEHRQFGRGLHPARAHDHFSDTKTFEDRGTIMGLDGTPSAMRTTSTAPLPATSTRAPTPRAPTPR